MKRFLVFLAVCFVCFSAFAEGEAGFVQGGAAAKCGGEYYLHVDEGETDALVRIDGEGRPYISIRAEELGGMAESDGTLYYLMREGDVWKLMGLSEGMAHTAYEFAPGAEADGLGVRDGMLFVLVDRKLHILYAQQGLCLQLAGARMAEYAIVDDFAYYISMDNVTAHKLADAAGNVAQAEAGALCRVNMSTGKTEVIVPEGADKLRIMDGKLYFHSYAHRYLMGAGESMSIEGYICSYDPASEEIVRLTDGYDWDYALAGGSVCALRQEGVVRLDDGAVLAVTPDNIQIEGAYDAVICYDPEEQTFDVVTVK